MDGTMSLPMSIITREGYIHQPALEVVEKVVTPRTNRAFTSRSGQRKRVNRDLSIKLYSTGYSPQFIGSKCKWRRD